MSLYDFAWTKSGSAKTAWAQAIGLLPNRIHAIVNGTRDITACANSNTRVELSLATEFETRTFRCNGAAEAADRNELSFITLSPSQGAVRAMDAIEFSIGQGQPQP